MRILIDIKHPAHVHFFKNFIKIMKNEGHNILVTAREKEMTTYLLDKYNIKYIKISSIGKSKLDLLKELFVRNYRFYKIARKFKPDVLLGLMGITIAPVGKLLGIPSLVFYDTENARLTNKIAYFFCTNFITPNCYRKKLGKKNIRYKGCHELTYLHPDYFKPNPNVLKKAGIKKGEKFTIIRFVSWGASHDVGHKGLLNNLKIKAVEEFSKYGKVFITSEKPLPKEIEKFRLTLPAEEVHHLMYYATLLYGESATMASEAAVLGTYAIYIDNEGRGYTDEEERKYGLVFNYSESKENQLKSIQKGVEILKNKNSKETAQEKRKKLLSDTVDVTKLIIKEVLKYKNKNATKKNNINTTIF